MVFLPDQVAEYDKKRMTAAEVVQLEIFVVDESSAIQWLKQQLEPQTPDLSGHPSTQFIRKKLRVGRSTRSCLNCPRCWTRTSCAMTALARFRARSTAYLSTNFKELRNLPKDHPGLRAKAKGRWYAPDPNKAVDVEMRRARILLREFDEYRQSSHSENSSSSASRRCAPDSSRPTRTSDYTTIISVAEKIPVAILQEDPEAHALV